MNLLINNQKLKEALLFYGQNDISVTALAKRLQICRVTLNQYFLELNLKNKKGIEYRKNIFQEDYFQNINTKDKAYFLGFLYADGCVSKKNGRSRIQLTLCNEDSYIISTFQNQIKSKHTLYNDRYKYTKLILESSIMVNDLIKLGCIPNKSLILKFPNKNQVPDIFLSHFIRGYFDGDGSISKKRKELMASFTSTELFLKELSVVLEQQGLIKVSRFYKRYKEKENSAGTIFIYQKKSTLDLYNFLYKECGEFYLKRKKLKFENL